MPGGHHLVEVRNVADPNHQYDLQPAELTQMQALFNTLPENQFANLKLIQFAPLKDKPSAMLSNQTCWAPGGDVSKLTCYIDTIQNRKSFPVDFNDALLRPFGNQAYNRLPRVEKSDWDALHAQNDSAIVTYADNYIKWTTGSEAVLLAAFSEAANGNNLPFRIALFMATHFVDPNIDSFVVFSTDPNGSMSSQSLFLSWKDNAIQLGVYTFQVQQNPDSGQLQVVSVQKGDQIWPLMPFDVSQGFQDAVPQIVTAPPSAGQRTDAAQPDGPPQARDATVRPTDSAPVTTDTTAQPNNVTVQPQVVPGQSPATCSAAQTQAPTNAVPGRPPRSTSKPGPGQTVVPTFCKPFSGDYRTVTFFDHDLPFEFNDHNGYQLTWLGWKFWPGIDGHNGYDWAMPEGTSLLAVAPGTVGFADATSPFACPVLGGRYTIGNTVIIEHQLVNASGEVQRLRTIYDHLSRIDVQVGQGVAAGDQIGLSGNTGCSGGPHVHFQTEVFAKGHFIWFDPYGWQGPAADPWAQDPRGTSSMWLWQDGQAPSLSLDLDQGPNVNASGAPAGKAPVAITFVRWLNAGGDQNPNDEFVELTLDPRYAASGTYDLSRHTLRNNAGDTFTFPDGFRIQQGGTVRVYVGSGQNTPYELYWGRSGGVFNPMGDCVQFQGPTWAGPYRLSLGKQCP